MNDARKKKIAEKAWKSCAKEIRNKLNSKLIVFSFYEFMEQQETFSIGKNFWEKLEQTGYADPKDITIVLKRLLSQKNDDKIYWFHEHTNEAGVLVVRLRDVISLNINDAKFPVTEELLLAGLDLKYGLCYEVGEDETFLRYWGF